MNEHETPAENVASTRETQRESARVVTSNSGAKNSDAKNSDAKNSDAQTRSDSDAARVLAPSTHDGEPSSHAQSATLSHAEGAEELAKDASQTQEANDATSQNDAVRVLAASSSSSKKVTKIAKTPDDEIVPIHDWIYWTMNGLFRVFFRIGGWRVHGRKNVPRRGGVILAPNHVSLFDPPLVGCATPRRVTTMGKAELFEKKWFGLKVFPYIIQHMATFPVKRGAPDRRAIRRAVQVLKDGEALVIFPEGTRTRSGKLGAGEIGVAMIAHKTKVPIVPVYLKGTSAALSPIAAKRGVRFFKTEVFYGEPLHFESEYSRRADRETLQAISDRVMQEISSLKERAEKRA